MTNSALDPIVKTIDLNASADRAFHHFTDNIGQWWPLIDHSLSKDQAKTVIFEAKDGGRIYEVEHSGQEREWGRIKECEHGRRVVFSWVLEDPDKQTEIEVLVEPTGDHASTLTLIHRGWENRSDGAEWRGYYNEGWDGVLGLYAQSM